MFNRRFRNNKPKEEEKEITQNLSDNQEENLSEETKAKIEQETKQEEPQVVNNVITNTSGLEKSIMNEANSRAIRELQRMEQETNPELLEGIGLSIFVDKKERKYLLFEIKYDINNLSNTELVLLKSSELREEIINEFKMKAGQIFIQLYK